MADDDDDDALFGGHEYGGGGDRLQGALLMLAGAAIFLGALGAIFYETELSFGHGLTAFQKRFVLIALFGVPVLFAGSWLYRWGKRVWKGTAG